jgi:hypothetical protein
MQVWEKNDKHAKHVASLTKVYGLRMIPLFKPYLF